jgi:hypothetical protein
VLQVPRLADALAQPPAPARPSRGDLVDALQVTDGVRQQPRQRGAQHQVLDLARRPVTHLLLDPGELDVAQHAVRAVVEDPPVP